MKFYIVLILFVSSLFGGGDIREANHCEDCGELAELLPYYGEDLPLAETYPCPPIEERECSDWAKNKPKIMVG